MMAAGQRVPRSAVLPQCVIPVRMSRFAGTELPLEAILTFLADCRISLAEQQGKTLPSWNVWDNDGEKRASGKNSQSSGGRRWGHKHQDAGDGAKRAAQNSVRAHDDGGQNGAGGQRVCEGLEV